MIDLQEFHAQDQQEHETVDQYLAALVRIDSACAYSGEDELLCVSCMNLCGLGGHLVYEIALFPDCMIRSYDGEYSKKHTMKS